MRAAVARRHRRDSNHCERSPRESVTLATRSRYRCEPEILSPPEKSLNSPVGKLYAQRSWTPAPACSDHGPGQTTPSVVIGGRHEELSDWGLKPASALDHSAKVSCCVGTRAKV